MRLLVSLSCLGLTSLALAQEPAKKAVKPKKPASSKKVLSAKAKPAEESPEASRPLPRWQFSLGLGYSMLGKTDFDEVSVSGEGFDVAGTAKFVWQNAPLLNAQAHMNFPSSSWSLNFGSSVDLERKLNEVAFTLEGVTAEGNDEGDDTSRVMQFLFYSNGVYRWRALAFSFGLNYSIVSFTAASEAEDVTVKGGPGFQTGLGLFLREYLAFELQYRISTFSIALDSGTGIFDLGRGRFSTAIVGLRYYINH